MRAARREALLALGLQDRRSGYPLEMVSRAAEPGWRVARSTVDYAPRRGRSKVTGTPLGRGPGGPGHVRGPGVMTRPRSTAARTVVLLAKEPVPGGQDPPERRAQPAEAAGLARAALADTLAAVGVEPRRAPGARAWTERRAPGCPRASTWCRSRRAGSTAARRGVRRRAGRPATGPALLVGMDTPQLGPHLPAVGLRRVDAVLGLDGRRRVLGVGLRAAGPRVVPRRADVDAGTGAAQLDRLARPGLRVRLLPPLRDVDTCPTRAAVALARTRRRGSPAAWRTSRRDRPAAPAAEVRSPR